MIVGNKRRTNRKTLNTIANRNWHVNQCELFGEASTLYTIHFSSNNLHYGFGGVLNTGFVLKRLKSKLRATN